MDYQTLSQEELIAELSKRDEKIAWLETDAKSRDVTTPNLETEAELNSLKAELEETRKLIAQREEELKKTKELNFALGRQVAREQQEVDVEETLHNIFGKVE